jgi:sugar phosphate isomerase/epimerase
MFINLGPPEIGIRCSLEECIRLAQKTGFQGLDVDIYEARRLIEQRGEKSIRNLFVDSGIQIGGWIWFDDFGFETDNETFGRYLKELPSLARTAELIGASRVLSWMLPYSDELNYEQNFELHVNRICEAAKILLEHGQKLAIEYIGPMTFRLGHTYPFIHDLSGAIELIETSGYQNVGLIMDSWHWYTSNATVEDIQKLSGDLAVYVHLSDAPANISVDQQVDNIRCLPGSTRVIDNVAFLKALDEIGYNGPITAEPFSEDINALPNEEAAQATATALNNLMKQAGLR